MIKFVTEICPIASPDYISEIVDAAIAKDQPHLNQLDLQIRMHLGPEGTKVYNALDDLHAKMQQTIIDAIIKTIHCPACESAGGCPETLTL